MGLIFVTLFCHELSVINLLLYFDYLSSSFIQTDHSGRAAGCRYIGSVSHSSTQLFHCQELVYC